MHSYHVIDKEGKVIVSQADVPGVKKSGWRAKLGDRAELTMVACSPNSGVSRRKLRGFLNEHWPPSTMAEILNNGLNNYIFYLPFFHSYTAYIYSKRLRTTA